MSQSERLRAAEQQRELIQRRLTVLHSWRDAVERRPKSVLEFKATLDFCRAWHAVHPELKLFSSKLYRWWNRYQLHGDIGLAHFGRIRTGKHSFKKVIPAEFWRLLWGYYLRWWIPKMETVVNSALAECSAELRTECERLVESGTVARRMNTVPDAVFKLRPIRKPTLSYNRTAAALARSRRVLRLLLWLGETETKVECVPRTATLGGQQ